MRSAHLLLGVLLLGAASCSDAPPTQPTPPVTPATPSAPAAAFTLTVDSLGSQEAISGVSEVTVDASGSTGAGLRFEIAFGDGETAATAVARHVYRTAGSYKVTVTVTDASGRNTTSTRDLVVASPLGRWVHSGFIERRGSVEVRTLSLTAQDGLTVRGTLTRFRNHAIPVTGTLTADRRVRLSVEDGSETFEGALASVLSTPTNWLLTAATGAISGETLTFARVDQPSGPEPDAVLDIDFRGFGAPFAVKQVSPVWFDAARSRGDGLKTFIEFGDREYVAAANATHPMQREGTYAARVTVVDRFGRSDSEVVEFQAWTLVNSGYYNEWSGSLLDGTRIVCSNVLLTFATQEGTSVSGGIYEYNGSACGPTSRFTGTVNADGQVRLQLTDAPTMLIGTMALPDFGELNQKLSLTYHGGPRDGETIRAYWRKDY